MESASCRSSHNAGVITDENIHYAVAEKIRKAMIDIGATLPEDLPAADKSIKVAEREEIIKLRQSKKPLMIDE
ncbi:hypothetical protein MASR2M70_18220 [Bacillota bacterium]